MDDLRCQGQAEESNRALWDEMARVHIGAYKEVDLLRRGEEILDPVELRELGDVRGKTMLHLQCHIGTDTLAWARHGAVVTGVDFSGQAIACAEGLRDELGLEATFLESNVYGLHAILDERFDVVYTSRGILCWLRDLNAWARIVAHFLKPGGVFYLLDSHPILNTLVERAPGDYGFVYRYFHQAEPTVWEAGGPDYADSSHALQNPSHEWAWALSDIVNAVLVAGLALESLNEHEHCFYKHLPSMTSDDGRTYRLPSSAGNLPLLFSLRATKPIGRGDRKS